MERLSQSWPVLGLAWLATTLLAAVPAWPLSRALSGLRDGSAASLERLFDLADVVAPLVLVTVLVLAIAALLGPLVSMTWLAALSRRSTLGEALARGSTLYFRAVAVTLMVAPVIAIGLGLATVLPLACATLLDGRAAEPTADIATAAAALPGLALVGAALTLQDLARAALCGIDSSPWKALRHAWDRLRAPALGTWFSLFVAGAVVAIVGHVLGKSTLDTGLLAVVLLQGVTLGRLTLRGLWLSYTIDAVA